MPREHQADIEFLRAVKSEILLGDFLAKETIRADDLRLGLSKAMTRRVVNHEKMIAHFVVPADIAPDQSGGGIRRRSAFLKKHLVTQTLRFPDFRFPGCEAQFEGA